MVGLRRGEVIAPGGFSAQRKGPRQRFSCVRSLVRVEAASGDFVEGMCRPGRNLLPVDRISGKGGASPGQAQQAWEHAGHRQYFRPCSGGLVRPGRSRPRHPGGEHGVMGALAETGGPCWVEKRYRGAGGTGDQPCWGGWGTVSTSRRTVNRFPLREPDSVERRCHHVLALASHLRCPAILITRVLQAVWSPAPHRLRPRREKLHASHTRSACRSGESGRARWMPCLRAGQRKACPARRGGSGLVDGAELLESQRDAEHS